MKHRLASLFACASLFAAACSDPRPATPPEPTARATVGPSGTSESRMESKPTATIAPTAPEKDGVPSTGEEVKSDAEQIAAFEKRVAK
jgi:hypothetical protein